MACPLSILFQKPSH